MICQILNFESPSPRIFLGLLLAVILCGCAAQSTSPAGRQQFLPSDEAAFSKKSVEIFTKRLNEYPRESDRSIVGYASCVFWALIAETGNNRTSKTWEVTVLADDNHLILSSGEGQFGITRGAVQTSTDKFVTSLAWAISAVIARHHSEMYQSRKSEITQSAVGQFFFGVLAPKPDTSVSQNLQTTLRLEGDLMGQALMAKAGFDPRGLVEQLKSIRPTTTETTESIRQRISAAKKELPNNLAVYENAKNRFGANRCPTESSPKTS